jgi:hypothetical protein
MTRLPAATAFTLTRATTLTMALAIGMTTAFLHAQPVTMAAYLQTAKEDGVLKARRADGELAFSAYGGLPWLKDMEFRVRNDALNPDYMRYTLKLEPRGFGEGRAADRYNEAEVKHSRQRDRLLLNRALMERYMVAVECLMRKAIHEVDLEMFAVLEDRIKVLVKSKDGLDFDLADLIEAEDDLTKIRSQDLEILKELDVLEQQAALHTTGGASDSGFAGFDTVGFVAVDDIIAEVEQGGFALDTAHVYLEYLKQGLTVAENRYKMEKAGGRQYLSSLSFSYDVGERLDEVGRRDEGKDYDLRRAYILEAGFRLPFLTTGNQELNRRKAQLLSEKEDYRQSRKELEDVMRKDIKDIHSLVVQYRYLRARETQVDAQASLKKYLQMSGVDPLALLSIKAGYLKNRIKVEEVKYGIIRNWIKVLDASGRLSQEPLRNWLAAGHPEIKR